MRQDHVQSVIPKALHIRDWRNLTARYVLEKSEVLYRGEKTALLSVGSMTEVCEQVCKELKNKGENPTFVNARFVKPLDTELLDELAKDHKLFVTVEEKCQKRWIW